MGRWGAGTLGLDEEIRTRSVATRIDPHWIQRVAGRWESRSGPESGSGSEKEVSVLNLSMMGLFWRRRSRSAQCGVVSSE